MGQSRENRANWNKEEKSKQSGELERALQSAAKAEIRMEQSREKGLTGMEKRIAEQSWEEQRAEQSGTEQWKIKQRGEKKRAKLSEAKWNRAQ